MAEKEKYLLSKGVARLLDISADDVIDLALKGKLRGVKLRHPWVFRLSDVEFYKREQKSK